MGRDIADSLVPPRFRQANLPPGTGKRFWRPEGLPLRSVMRLEGERRLWSTCVEYHSVSVLIGGAFDGWYRGKVRTLCVGSLKLKEPGEVHRGLKVHAPFSIQSVGFERAFVEESRQALGLPSDFRLRPVESSRKLRAVRLALRMHAALAAEEKGPASLELQTLVTETWMEILATCTERGELVVHERAPRAVRRAREYLRARMPEHVNLDALAEHAGMDKFHLVRAFRAELGLPPYEYLTHLRVARAASLLAGGTAPAQAALEVGLYDESQLHRHFRRIVGLSPGRYARQHRPSRATARRLA